MCGIIGYVGRDPAMGRLLTGLERLEYRGYDSAGICTLNGHGLEHVKAVGNLAKLKEKTHTLSPTGSIGIGHTRWATHGRVTEENAHPFIAGDTAIVLNGIIENYVELREGLIERGAEFTSETDAEVVAHLIEQNYWTSLTQAVADTYAELEGHFAFAAVHREHPDTLVGTRFKCPMVVGIGEGEAFVASSVVALGGQVDHVMTVNDAEIIVATPNEVAVMSLDGVILNRDKTPMQWDGELAEKQGYDTFMLKEIHEQPNAIATTLHEPIDIDLPLRDIERVIMVACGTAYHAGLVGGYAIEEWAGIPLEPHIASEWQYRRPFINDKTLVLGISQSGETADTLASLRLARSLGAKTIALTNSPDSQITREVDNVLLTKGGMEIGVAATKTFVSQVTMMYQLAIRMGIENEQLSSKDAVALMDELQTLPSKVTSVLEGQTEIEALALRYCDEPFFMYLGRHVNLPIALEGALKLKEVTYIPTDAYAAGEMKHGPIALLGDGVPVVTVATDSAVIEKMMSNIQESRARGARIIAIGTEGNESLEAVSDDVIYVPETHPLMAPILSVVPLQLLAYHIARLRELDVDKPRNLAKTVTVE